MDESLKESLKRLTDVFLCKNRLWYNWHKIIYSAKISLSSEELYADEVYHGINFRKFMGPEYIC